MSAWVPQTLCGIVVCPFDHPNKQCLKLRMGDVVLIKYGNNEWYKGAVYDAKTKTEKKGFFPCSIVAFSASRSRSKISKRDAHINEKKFDLDKNQQVVQMLELPPGSWWEPELQNPFFWYITNVIADWAPNFEGWLKEEINEDMLERILVVQVRILSLVDRKRAVTEEIATQVDRFIEEGCSILNEDVIIRRDGIPLDQTNATAVSLYRQYFDQQKKEEKEKEVLKEKRRKMLNMDKKEKRTLTLFAKQDSARQSTRAVSTKEYYHLPEGNSQMLMEVDQCVFQMDDKLEVYFSLYSGVEGRIVSENFLVPLPANNENEAPDLAVRRKTIFQNLCARDIIKDLYIVVHVYRSTNVIKQEGDKKKSKTVTQNDGIGSEAFLAYKRPFGIGVLELSPAIISTLVRGDKYTTSENIPIFQPADKGHKEEMYSTMIDTVIELTLSKQQTPKPSSNTPILANVTMTKGIGLSLSLFMMEYADLIEKRPELSWTPLSSNRLSGSMNPQLVRSQSVTERVQPTGNVARTQIMAFPETVSPSDRRNDIYVTVSSAQLAISVKNVQLEAKLYLEGETKPQQCICPAVNCARGENEQLTDSWKSSVYYHAKSPKWNETFRLNIDPKDLERAVLAFTFFDCDKSKNTPVGFSYWEVMNNKGLLNLNRNDNAVEGVEGDAEGGSSLTVYKVSKTNAWQDNIHAFIKNTPERSKLGNNKSTLYLQHTVVSTVVTNNENLRNLLHWEKVQRTKGLDDILKHFLFCEPDETKTFLREIFDALFAILAKAGERSEQEQEKVAELVYRALCQMIGSMSADVRVIIDEYVVSHFNCPAAYKWILVEMNKRLDEMAKTLADTMKALGYLLQFIVSSRKQYEEQKKTDSSFDMNADRASFRTTIVNLLKKFEAVLQSDKPILVGAQEYLLKFITFDPLVSVFAGEEMQLGHVIKSFLDSVVPPTVEKRGGMIKAKLELLRSISQGDVFKQHASRMIILPKIYDELEVHFGRLNQAEPTPSTGSSEQTYCIRIYGDMIDALQSLLEQPCDALDLGAITDSLHTLFALTRELRNYFEVLVTESAALKPAEESFTVEGTDLKPSEKVSPQNSPMSPTIEVTATKDTKHESRRIENERARAEIISDILALLFVYSHFNLIKKHIELDGGVGGGLTTLDEFFRLQQLVMSEHNPISKGIWIQYLVFMFNVSFAKSIDAVSGALLSLRSQCDVESFTARFSTFIDNVFRAVLQVPALETEHMSTFKRKKILEGNGGVDTRTTVLEIFLKRWHELGTELKRLYVPSIINKVIRVFEITEDSVPAVAVDIYVDILRVEFQQTQNVHKCEGVTQKCLIEAKVDDHFKRVFINGLTLKFAEGEASLPFNQMGFEFIDRMSTMIVQVEKIQQYPDSAEDEKVDLFLDVMSAFKSRGNLDLYLAYAHELCKTHLALGNFVEAALTLGLHADHLSFENNTLLPFFSEEYKEEKESKRKEKLMHRMIELLDKGRDWERAIDLCKSLRKYYKNTWQFSELGLLHQKEGTFYTNVMSFKRFPTFYYVAFYGKGFKEMGLEGVYLFKSKELENHVDFSEKMKLKYPGAEILTKIDKDALNEKEGKYLEIYAITPITDREIKNLYEPRDTRRLPSIVRNEQLKTVPYLSTTRRYRESKEKAKDGFEFVDMHREIRVFVVPEPYPATRRRQKCNDTIIVDLGPIENAIKDVEDKNLDLQDEAIHRQLNLTEDRTGDTRDLSRLLTGIIDAAVNGGTKKYVDVFFGEPYRTNDREKLLRFAVALKNQMEDLKSCLYFLRYYSSGKGLALCDHLESNYGKMTEVFDPIFKEYLDGVPVQPVEQPTTEQPQN